MCYLRVISPPVIEKLDSWNPANHHPSTSSSWESLHFLGILTDEVPAWPWPGIILAVGNFLNGGTNRGQADGFDLESLAKLEGIKDATGKDIRLGM